MTDRKWSVVEIVDLLPLLKYDANRPRDFPVVAPEIGDGMNTADPTAAYFAMIALGIVCCAIPITLLMPRLLGWRILGMACVVCGVLLAAIRVAEVSREPVQSPLTMAALGIAVYVVAGMWSGKKGNGTPLGSPPDPRSDPSRTLSG